MTWQPVPDWDGFVATPGDTIRVGNYYRRADGTAADHPHWEPGVTPVGWTLETGVSQPPDPIQALTLAEFLLARIADDETDADALDKELGRWKREHAVNGADGSQGSFVALAVGGGPADPDRITAECEAKRRIIALHVADKQSARRP